MLWLGIGCFLIALVTYLSLTGKPMKVEVLPGKDSEPAKPTDYTHTEIIIHPSEKLHLKPPKNPDGSFKTFTAIGLTHEEVLKHFGKPSAGARTLKEQAAI